MLQQRIIIINTHAENSLNKYKIKHARNFHTNATAPQIPIERNGWSKSHTSENFTYSIDTRFDALFTRETCIEHAACRTRLCFSI